MAAQSRPDAPRIRMVPCPTCKGDSVFAASNPYRPFCCARCKDVDFGAWAEEGFRVPAAQDPDETPGETPGLQ